MRVVIQRVKRASVDVGGAQVSSIGQGVLALIGIAATDTEQDMKAVVKKILNLRLFPTPGQDDGWKKSVTEIAGEVLCVSQFTLLADLSKGQKPSFHKAMLAATSRDFYERFLSSMREAYAPEKIKDGQFGAMMDVSLVNDGPVTILFDSAAPKASGQATPLQQQPPAVESTDVSLSDRFKEAMTESY